MSQVIAHTITTDTNTPVPSNWKSEKNSYSCDDMIDAYFIGKQDGENAYIETIKQKFVSNFQQASQINEEVINFLSKKKISFKSAHLKPTPPFQFEVALVVDAKDYLSEKFESAYDMTYEISQKYNTSTFKVSFYFIPNTEHLNVRRIVSDGYVFSYSPNGKKKTHRSRKSQS